MSHAISTSHNGGITEQSPERQARLLSTHDTLLQRRRTELYASCLRAHRRRLAKFEEIISGEAVARNHDLLVFDVTTNIYERDYAELSEYFQATPLSETMVEIRPIPRHDETPMREVIEQRFSLSPFRRRLGEVTDELSSLLVLSPEPGEYSLGAELKCDDPVDQMVAQTIVDGQLVRRDTHSQIIVSISETNEDEASLYLQTDGATELFNAFDDAGMVVSDEAQRELILEVDSRYGNAYAWMSREIVKAIAGYESDLFEGSAADRLPAYTADPAANLLIDALRQVVLRGDGPYASDIPVTNEYVNLRDKGCKDVEVYFSQSNAIVGKLQIVAIAGKSFWHKTHGGHTYINLEPIIYCGVELPPGYVFKRAEDGGYALLRVTGFAFDKQTADQLFGAPMTNIYEMQGEEDVMAAAFDRFQADRAKVTQS